MGAAPGRARVPCSALARDVLPLLGGGRLGRPASGPGPFSFCRRWKTRPGRAAGLQNSGRGRFPVLKGRLSEQLLFPQKGPFGLLCCAYSGGAGPGQDRVGGDQEAASGSKPAAWPVRSLGAGRIHSRRGAGRIVRPGWSSVLARIADGAVARRMLRRGGGLLNKPATLEPGLQLSLPVLLLNQGSVLYPG